MGYDCSGYDLSHLLLLLLFHQWALELLDLALEGLDRSVMQLRRRRTSIHLQGKSPRLWLHIGEYCTMAYSFVFGCSFLRLKLRFHYYR